jgi:hypothetical protein
MESMESHKNWLSMLPTPLGNPCGGFPHYHGYGDDYYVSEDRQSPPKTRNQSHSRRKGLVNHVPGLKRKGCPGTLTPERTSHLRYKTDQGPALQRRGTLMVPQRWSYAR